MERTGKIKVVFVIDSLGGGGAERVVSLLSNRFSEQGYDVSIVMLHKQSLAYQIDEKVHIIYAGELHNKTFYAKIVNRLFCIYSRLRQGVYKPIMQKLGKYEGKPKNNETAFFYYKTYALPIRGFLKNNGNCTAFGFLVQSNICLLQAARHLKNVDVVFCERNNPVRPDMTPSIIKLRDKLYRFADKGVFQTDEEMEYYTKLLGKKYVIPNPIKDGLPYATVGSHRKEIVNFCRIEPQKNLPLLVDAFELLIEDHPDYILRIYGNGWYSEQLAEYIKRKQLETVVRLEPFAPDIHDCIKDAAMFVSTSDFEGLSNSMLEAMAIGLPCVCTDCDGGGARMMIKDHENGLLVPKGDVQAVYQAMKEIIEKPELAEKLSENARKIRDELSVDKIVKKWMEVIGE